MNPIESGLARRIYELESALQNERARAESAEQALADAVASRNRALDEMIDERGIRQRAQAERDEARRERDEWKEADGQDYALAVKRTSEVAALEATIAASQRVSGYPFCPECGMDWIGHPCSAPYRAVVEAARRCYAVHTSEEQVSPELTPWCWEHCSGKGCQLRVALSALPTPRPAGEASE